ncbi:hypothetical protein VE01_06752 [Pseudogymnoascus verrucosus]|uniref:Uncharacterized protein n=1 Tax=Pseudogymnoascus verrucosus TaxID=342668 RepID=A0A1B8GJL2_9PEZI|nr:uncharacterized protein VE01_06752 [Pseudogymnoascus verrucosus]OBT96009.1 hypothetical protein VE01_06752 [Pseudogymnoascus verrucosus]
MIINELPPDSSTTSNPPPRQFFANQPPPTAPRIIEEVPNNAARKTLAELFASYPKPGQPSQPSTDTTTYPPSQNGPVLTHNQPIIDTNTAQPTPPDAPQSSYNPTQHVGPPQCLWFPPRPPGQDIDGNTSIPDNPWTPLPLSATMVDGPYSPVAPKTPIVPRNQSISMPDRPRTPASKFKTFFSDILSSATAVPSKSAKSHISNPAVQPSRRHSTVNSNLRHPRSEQTHTRRTLATALALPDSPTSVPKYVNPFLTRPITVPPRVTIHPKSSPENVSPHTPTAPAPQFPDAPFPQLNTHPFGVPPTVHVLADWPYGPILETMSPRTRRFAIGGTDADGNDMKIYRPRLDRDTYLECLPPASRVVVCCTSSACGAICELDGRAGACRRRSAPVKDAARWERYMWSCEGCGEDMEMQVLKESEGNSPTGTGDACYKKDEQDA